METRRRCDCLSGPCCQAVSTALPGRVSGTSFRCTHNGGENGSFCLASTLHCESALSIYLPNEHPDWEKTLDASLTTSPHSKFSRTSQGASQPSCSHSLAVF